MFINQIASASPRNDLLLIAVVLIYILIPKRYFVREQPADVGVGGRSGCPASKNMLSILNDKAKSSNECQMTKSKVQIWHLSFNIWILNLESSNPAFSIKEVGRTRW
jgi:hypothetical protein